MQVLRRHSYNDRNDRTFRSMPSVKDMNITNNKTNERRERFKLITVNASQQTKGGKGYYAHTGSYRMSSMHLSTDAVKK